jgi:hypothetical protein
MELVEEAGDTSVGAPLAKPADAEVDDGDPKVADLEGNRVSIPLMEHRHRWFDLMADHVPEVTDQQLLGSALAERIDEVHHP